MMKVLYLSSLDLSYLILPLYKSYLFQFIHKQSRLHENRLRHETPKAKKYIRIHQLEKPFHQIFDCINIPSVALRNSIT